LISHLTTVLAPPTVVVVESNRVSEARCECTAVLATFRGTDPMTGWERVGDVVDRVVAELAEIEITRLALDREIRWCSGERRPPRLGSWAARNEAPAS